MAVCAASHDEGSYNQLRHEMCDTLVDKQTVLCYRVKNVSEVIVGFLL